MSFKEEHPDYKTYESSKMPCLFYANLPCGFQWSELESLVDEAGGPNRELLAKVVQKMATKVRAGSVSGGNPYDWIAYVITKMREKVREGKFYVFMDCLAILCDDGELNPETLNEFLEENRIGYRACNGGWNHGIFWERIGDDAEDEEKKTDKDAMTGEEPKNKMSIKDKPTKIFITHSSVDKEYVLALTDLLRKLKVPNEAIICTSDCRHGIPNGMNTYKWLREQFMDAELHMIFVLSENYYNSIPCLNEMGAAWLVAKKSDLLLLPGFGFEELKNKGGCLDKDAQGGSIDSEDGKLKAWLANLRDDVIQELDLEKPNELDWEDFRDGFINQMRRIE